MLNHLHPRSFISFIMNNETFTHLHEQEENSKKVLLYDTTINTEQASIHNKYKYRNTNKPYIGPLILNYACRKEWKNSWAMEKHVGRNVLGCYMDIEHDLHICENRKWRTSYWKRYLYCGDTYTASYQLPVGHSLQPGSCYPQEVQHPL